MKRFLLWLVLVPTLGCATESGDETMTIDERLACDTTFDFETGFFGPEWDADSDRLNPGFDSFVVSTTVAVPKEGADEEFQALNDSMMPLLSREGVLATNFSGSETCRTARTLTIWRDEAAMNEFVMSTEHLGAIARSLAVVDGGKTTRWEATSVPTWDEARKRLDEESSF